MTKDKVAASAQRHAGDTWSWCPERDSPATKSSLALGATLYEEGMASAARFCSEQAVHFRNLSECRNPWDLAAYQTEFLEKLVAFGIDENRRAKDRLARAFKAS